MCKIRNLKNQRRFWKSLMLLFPMITAQVNAQYDTEFTSDTVYDPGVVYYASPSVKNLYVPAPAGLPNARVTSNSQIVVDYQGDWTPTAKAAFEFAMRIWERTLGSSVPIKIQAEYQKQESWKLASARSNTAIAEQNSLVYPYALADKLSENDLDPANPDIYIQINSDANWYYGLDGQVPANQYDFVTVVLHEIGHGLGFSSSARMQGNQLVYGYVRNGRGLANVYDVFVNHKTSGTNLVSFPVNSSSASLTTFLTSNDLIWTGGNASNTKLYAPSVYTSGSSISHLDESTYVNNLDALMTPSLSKAEAIHNPGGLVRGILKDIGWEVSPITGFEDDANMRMYVSGNSYGGGNLPSSFSNIQCRAEFIDEQDEFGHYGDFLTDTSFKLVAEHATGSLVLKSYDGYTFLLTPSDFVLPSGYDWNRAENGRVKTKILMETVDNDGAIHKDGYYIYVPEAPNEVEVAFNNSCGNVVLGFNGEGTNQYTLYYQKSGQSSQTIVLGGDVHSHSFSSLDAGSNYSFWVTASNNYGVSSSDTIITSVVSCSSTSVSSNGLLFDKAQQDRVTVPHDSAYDIGTGDFTVEAWVSLSTSQSSFPAVIGNRSGHFNGFLFFFYNGIPYAKVGSPTYSAPNTSMNLYDGQCHHVALVKKDTMIEFFVDGASFGTRYVGTKNVNTGHDLWIGHDYNTGATALDGSIKEVRFWNIARSEGQISAAKDFQLSGSESGLIGYWKLDDTTGQVVQDYSTLAHDGYLGSQTVADVNDPILITNDCGVNDQPISDNALEFNKAEQDRVTIPHDSLYDLGTGDFTAEAWVSLNASQNSFPAVIGNRSGHFNGFLFFFFNGIPYAKVGSPTYSAPNTSMNLYDGQCHHVALVKKDTIIEFFVDGTSFGTRHVGIKDVTTGHDLWIGHDYNTGATALDGSIKEVRFWNVARTVTEINDNQFIQLKGNESGLIGYWKLDDATGQIVTDYSIYGNDGVLGSTSSSETIDPVWVIEDCTGAVSKEGNSESAFEGIEEENVSVKAYPNPFTHELVLELTKDTNVEINVFTSEGVLIEQLSIKSSGKVMVGQNWQEGLYILQVIGANGYQTIKAIKK